MYAKLRQDIGVRDKWGDKVLVASVNPTDHTCLVLDDAGNATQVSLSNLVCSKDDLTKCMDVTSQIMRDKLRAKVKSIFENTVVEHRPAARRQQHADVNQQIQLPTTGRRNGDAVDVQTSGADYTVYNVDCSTISTMPTVDRVGQDSGGRG